MEESTVVDNSAATSLKICQKSLSNWGSCKWEWEISYPRKEGSLFHGEMALGQNSHPEETERIEFTTWRAMWKQRVVSEREEHNSCFPEPSREGQQLMLAGFLRVPGASEGDTPTDKRKADTFQGLRWQEEIECLNISAIHSHLLHGMSKFKGMFNSIIPVFTYLQLKLVFKIKKLGRTLYFAQVASFWTGNIWVLSG